MIYFEPNLVVEHVPDSKKKFTFQIKAATGALRASKFVNGAPAEGNHDTFMFAARSQDELDSWIETLRKIIDRRLFFVEFYSKLPPDSPLKRPPFQIT